MASKKTESKKRINTKKAPVKKTAGKSAKPAAKSKSTAKKGAGKGGVRSATTWRNRQMAPTAERYRQIQGALAAKGFLRPEEVTGVWNASSVDALKQFQAALESNHNSSLAHYRVAEVFYLQRNYQAAANAYREALNGDGEPKWTEVWCHIQLGKIYDLTGQRERATNEYRQALLTNDNTQGAQDEAHKYLGAPYQRTSTGASGQ